MTKTVAIQDVKAYEVGQRDGADIETAYVNGHRASDDATQHADGYVLARFGIPIRERQWVAHNVKSAHKSFFYGYLVGAGAAKVEAIERRVVQSIEAGRASF